MSLVGCFHCFDMKYFVTETSGLVLASKWPMGVGKDTICIRGRCYYLPFGWGSEYISSFFRITTIESLLTFAGKTNMHLYLLSQSGCDSVYKRYLTCESEYSRGC